MYSAILYRPLWISPDDDYASYSDLDVMYGNDDEELKEEIRNQVKIHFAYQRKYPDVHYEPLEVKAFLPRLPGETKSEWVNRCQDFSDGILDFVVDAVWEEEKLKVKLELEEKALEAKMIKDAENAIKQAKDKETRYQDYLRLKEEFHCTQYEEGMLR